MSRPTDRPTTSFRSFGVQRTEALKGLSADSSMASGCWQRSREAYIASRESQYKHAVNLFLPQSSIHLFSPVPQSNSIIRSMTKQPTTQPTDRPTPFSNGTTGSRSKLSLRTKLCDRTDGLKRLPFSSFVRPEAVKAWNRPTDRHTGL